MGVRDLTLDERPVLTHGGAAFYPRAAGISHRVRAKFTFAGDGTRHMLGACSIRMIQPHSNA